MSDSGLVALVTGTMLGSYRIEELLGRGGMGAVYLAYDTRLHRQASLKVLSEPSDDAREHLLREARSAAALSHPNICTVYEVGEVGGLSFIAMEYVKGPSLGDLIARGAVSLPEALIWGRQVAEALMYAHARGVIHRDLKAANVIVGDDGRVKVVDFGLARRQFGPTGEATTVATVAPAGAVMGTPYAMAPEQVRGAPCDGRTDIWALGVLLHEMASGQRPFQAASSADLFSSILRDPPRALPVSVPHTLAAVICRCLERLPERRYQSADEVVSALAAVRPETIRAAPGGRLRKYARPIAAGAVLVALVVVAATFGRSWLAQRAAAHAPGGLSRATDSQAYELYLRGLSHLHRASEADVDQAISLFEQAVARDPKLLPAQAQLAMAYGNKSSLYAANDPQWEEKGFAAAQRALDLDPTSAEAHYALGVLLWRPSHGFPAAQALAELRKAVTARPDFTEAWEQHAMILLHVGHLEEARAEVGRIMQLNPAYIIARFRLAPIDNYEQKFTEAIAVLNSVPRDTNPALWTYHMAWALISLGRLDEAGRLLDGALAGNPTDQGGVMHAARAMLEARRGQRAAAETDVAEAIRAGRGFQHFHHTAYSIGAVYAALGDLSSAEDWIRQSANDGFPNYLFFETDVHLAPLRARASFRTFVAGLRRQWEHLPGEPDAASLRPGASP